MVDCWKNLLNLYWLQNKSFISKVMRIFIKKILTKVVFFKMVIFIIITISGFHNLILEASRMFVNVCVFFIFRTYQNKKKGFQSLKIVIIIFFSKIIYYMMINFGSLVQIGIRDNSLKLWERKKKKTFSFFFFLSFDPIEKKKYFFFFLSFS